MTANPQAILLPEQLPPELRAFLKGYLYTIDGQQFLLTRSFDVEGYFVALDLLKNEANRKGKPWKVRLPLQFVLAVAQIKDRQAPSIGFL